MRQIERLVGDLLDQARLARRHLADDRGEHRDCLPVRDRGHLHRHVVGFERDIAVALAERRFGLELLGIDQALDHDLGVGRHVEVDGDALDHRHRPAGEPAGDAELVEIDVELLRAGEHHHRRRADHDRDRHRLSCACCTSPSADSRPPRPARATMRTTSAVGRFQRSAIGAAVLDAGVRVLGDAEGGAEIRRGVEAGRRDRHRQELQPAVRLAQIVAGDDDLLAARGVGPDRRDRMRDRLHPALADVLDRGAHAERIDFRRRRDRADHHRHVVFAARSQSTTLVNRKARALGLRNAADELQPHQRMQLGVLVDRMVDPRQQAPRFEVGEVLLQIEPRLRAGSLRACCRHVIHVRDASSQRRAHLL